MCVWPQPETKHGDMCVGLLTVRWRVVTILAMNITMPRDLAEFHAHMTHALQPLETNVGKMPDVNDVTRKLQGHP